MAVIGFRQGQATLLESAPGVAVGQSWRLLSLTLWGSQPSGRDGTVSESMGAAPPLPSCATWDRTYPLSVDRVHRHALRSGDRLRPSEIALRSSHGRVPPHSLALNCSPVSGHLLRFGSRRRPLCGPVLCEVGFPRPGLPFPTCFVCDASLAFAADCARFPRLFA